MVLEPEVLRLFDRIIISLGGILSIYLGYRLFSITRDNSSEASIKLRDVLDTSFKRVGPGVFFAVFGAWVLYTSIKSPVEVRHLVQSREEAKYAQESIDAIRDLVDKFPELEQSKVISHLGVLELYLGTGGERGDFFIGEQPTPEELLNDMIDG